ncbi:pectate lyase superfamily protein-domain-containing protein [Aspergillus cavernicola]|uniref:Pectate lyase superfamily protein-domain-containing protein n=1 Tax=Aspergillus cavernicola TaxID=176166 RepID=A0ABR4IJ32_9EURO
MLFMLRYGLLVAAALAVPSSAQVSIPREPVGAAPPLPPGEPHIDVNNYFGTAPDQGSLNGPILELLNASTLAEIHGTIETRQGDGYWLASLGSAGQSPFAPSGYQFFRNVRDFGAVGDGVTDDTAAINRAAAAFSESDTSTLRCGEECGSTTTLGAVVYFPAGTYLISTPITQYYYTQFVGNPNSRAVIRGTSNFTGIALVDSNVYIPGGNGDEWYINQSNFYRQIRNLEFDMTGMNWTNYDNDQEYVPAGIHWQVGQATSITNCNFQMSVSDGAQRATAVGIYMENGSGGVVSDLTFFGGNIGFLAGSQQFTANNLQFTSCLTAIYHVWNWGFVWKNIYVLSCYVALDCTAYSGGQNQGTGSITVLDSHFNGVPYAITVASQGDQQPNIVLDNLLVENSQSVVLISGGDTILEGSSGPLYFNSWANGYQVISDGTSGERTGFMSPAPRKSSSLLDGSGAYFTRSKPQYSGSSPIVATDNGVSNDGTGDQTDAINSLLSGNVGSLIFFPGGVYLVEGTVYIPVGSIIVGSGWSQIMGTGSFFEDAENPQVMVQVGNEGDSGVIEISDMMFTVQGPTAGALLMEWNVHESSQGSAAMWDSHFRVGGAEGTNLQLEDCPAQSDVNPDCMAASLLLHITTDSSGYFDNVWVWVADHDLDNPLNSEAYNDEEGIPVNVQTQISIYAARGVLIESQGPTWLYGSSSEHMQMYHYQLQNASNIFLGHMQTETPYYQPNPNALEPYTAGGSGFPSDPTFDNCADDLCTGAWALRVLDSTEIFIYAAGFYSFFQDNQLGCTAEENCQLALIETNFASSLWIYNIFTKGNIEIVTPRGGLPPLLFNSTTRNGYTSEIAAWLALSTQGEVIGSEPGEGSGIVTIDPDLWSGETAFSFPPLTTSITVGYNSTTTFEISGSTSTRTIYQITIVTTTISIPPVTTSVISWFDETVTVNSTIIYPIPSIIGPPFTITEPTVIEGTTYPPDTRTFWPPPWPGSSEPPTGTPTTTTSTSHTSDDNDITSVHHTDGPPRPSCRHVTGCGSRCGDSIFDICLPCWIGCGIGPPGINGIDPDQPGGIPPGLDPNNPDNDPDESECETSTFSSCNTYCTQSPTSSCSTSCVDVVGCEETTGTVSSCTPPTGIEIWTPTDTAADAPTLGAGGDFGYIYLPGPTGTGGTTTTMSPPPTSTSTSTSTSETSTSSTTTTSEPDPEPTETVPLCLGLWTAATGQFPIYNWIIYSPVDPCSGIYITDGNIGESTPICDISINNTPFDWCEEGDEAGTFVDSGPQFFSDPSCGFQIRLFGNSYTPEQLEPLEEGNPCDATCPGNLASIQGVFLWDALPACD